jgi:hypothetical protein
MKRNKYSDRHNTSRLVLSTITDTETNHAFYKEREYSEFVLLQRVFYESDIPGSKKFGWCVNNPSCFLNISNFSECKRKLAKRCVLENNCLTCHRCEERCWDDWGDEIFCSCNDCEKERFPCQHRKSSCFCKLCQKIPDISPIPKELYIFNRAEVERCFSEQPRPDLPPRTWRAKIVAKFHRKSLFNDGPSVVATHFAQERFSEEHLKNIDKTAVVKKLISGVTPPNFDDNLLAWKRHVEIKKAVHEFRKKYHRFPPCFRERFNIRSMTKVRNAYMTKK